MEQKEEEGYGTVGQGSEREGHAVEFGSSLESREVGRRRAGSEWEIARAKPNQGARVNGLPCRAECHEGFSV